MWNCSRRGFAGYLLALLSPARLKSHPVEIAPSPARTNVRTYRADAVILLLGFSMYRRPGVGGGQASLDEAGEGDALRRTLFFAGGSDPKHAHGVGRLGWIRETVIGPVAKPSAADYFGVMTSSPEESLEHARKVVDAAPAGTTVFSAVSGRNTAGLSRSAITRFEHPAAALWSDRALIDQAQSTFHQNVDWRETAWPNSPTHAPSTFLLELATLLKQRTRRATGRYVYNEQEYSLELDTAAPGRDGLVPVRGKIRNTRTGKENLFKLWLEQGSDSIVPVRIEYQARSFLRLTFEAVAG